MKMNFKDNLGINFATDIKEMHHQHVVCVASFKGRHEPI